MKPTRDEIKRAVYVAVHAISGRDIADLKEEMVLGGQMPTGVGMDQTAIDAVAGTLNIWIRHRGGRDSIRAGELTPSTTLGETIDVVDSKF